jgi:16S rRNA C1402 N4-methylase RsmH
MVAFKTLGKEPGFRLLTPHAIKPEYAEIRQNRQARSARLRVIEKLADT